MSNSMLLIGYAPLQKKSHNFVQVTIFTVYLESSSNKRYFALGTKRPKYDPWYDKDPGYSKKGGTHAYDPKV